VSLKRFLVLARDLKVGKPRLCCFFLQNSTQLPSLEAFIIVYVCQILFYEIHQLGMKGQL